MATKSPAVRKPAAKPLRTLAFDRDEMTLVIAVGKLAVAYCLFELPCDDAGRRVWRLGKYDLTEKYTVSVKAGVAECDCKGGVYAGHCKHGDALKSLVAAGKL